MIILRSHILLSLGLLPFIFKEIGATRNLAYYKPATESSYIYGQPADGAADAVDNDPLGTCAQPDTGLGGSPAWWQIDLQNESYITSVTIQFPDSTDCQYVQGFVIVVTNNSSPSSSTPVCYTFSNGSDAGSGDTVTLRGLHPTFTCIQPLIGRYVKITRQGGYQNRSMVLCDVQVNGIMIDLTERARGQPATQSQYTLAGRVAGLAVDGNTTSCSRTDTQSNIYAWWVVDLLDLYSVSSVSVLAANTIGDAQYLGNISIYVSNTFTTDSFLPAELCSSYSSSNVSISAQLNLTCGQEVLGRYVIIKRNGGPRPSALTLCEVNIFARYNPPTTTIPPTSTTTEPMLSGTATTTAGPMISGSPSIASMPSPGSPQSIQGPALIGTIVGCVLGGMLLNTALIIIIWVVCKRSRMSSGDKNYEFPPTLPMPGSSDSLSESGTPPYLVRRLSFRKKVSPPSSVITSSGPLSAKEVELSSYTTPDTTNSPEPTTYEELDFKYLSLIN